ncbi:hypothetical protein GIB67_023556 [Kingdonia uniflora]|uniref:S-protein homolog n=1 Tax=Kingdonia uniflora TaxID=39325 RepID=A0A7J7P9W9_9MAGN|nr:hypothetical protein GIB67_023556 [Kingdonia uniflora]
MLHYNNDYTWHFGTNFFASTLFWCWVGWRDHNGKWVQKSFVVFREKFNFWNNYCLCNIQCYWTITPNGIYLSSDGDKDEFMYSWDWGKVATKEFEQLHFN